MKALNIIVAALFSAAVVPTTAVSQQRVHMDSQGNYCINPLGVSQLPDNSGYYVMKWYNRCDFLIVIEWSRVAPRTGQLFQSTTNVYGQREGTALLLESDRLSWNERVDD